MLNLAQSLAVIGFCAVLTAFADGTRSLFSLLTEDVKGDMRHAE
jgi:hypothetical protein